LDGVLGTEKIGVFVFLFMRLGAIILLDARFMSDNGRLSKWVQNYIQKFHAFGEAQEQLSEFFKKCHERQVNQKKERAKMERENLGKEPMSLMDKV
jgi:hypothetical protein